MYDDFKTWYEAFQVFMTNLREKSSDLLKFWLSYIEICEPVLNLIFATRTRNWKLYLSCIEEIIPWCFAYDRQIFDSILERNAKFTIVYAWSFKIQSDIFWRNRRLSQACTFTVFPLLHCGHCYSPLRTPSSSFPLFVSNNTWIICTKSQQFPHMWPLIHQSKVQVAPTNIWQ